MVAFAVMSMVSRVPLQGLVVMIRLAADLELARAGVEVALLDADGVIVEVNEAWANFAVANGGDPSCTGVGLSYLAVCDTMGDDEASVALAAAVRAAIRGDLPAPMTIRISCDAPATPRLFDVLVSPRVGISGEHRGATVTLSPTTAAGPDTAEAAPVVEPVDSLFDSSTELVLLDRPRLELEELLRGFTSQATGDAGTQGRLRALLRANAAVASDLSLPVLLRHVVGAARELVDARHAELGVVSTEGTLTDIVYAGIDPATVEGVGGLSHREGLLSLLVDDPESLRLKGVGDRPDGTGFLPNDHPLMAGLLVIPIRVRDHVFANLYLTDPIRGEFTDEDEQLVMALAGSAGVAIENARLFAQATQQRQWLEASTEMTQRLFAGTGEDPLDLVLRYAARGASADFARVVVPHDDQHGRVQAQIGSVDRLRPGDLLELDNTVCGRIFATAEPLLVSDFEGESTSSARLTDVPDGIGAVAGLPLLDSDEGVLGALVVVREPGRAPFIEQDLQLLTSFAHHAGIAIALDRARADREALLLVADHDRIAADLHDHVIQQLFATGLGLHSLVPHQSRPEHQKRLFGYVDALDDTIRRIRTTIFQLQMPYLEPGRRGLRDRLMAVLDDERPALGFSVDIAFSGNLDRDVPADLGDDVVAVLREALSNIARHAHADTAEVRVALVGSVLEVDVSDDGTGIRKVSRSSGLTNLRSRAEARQGTFETASPDTGGTHLHWTAIIGPAPD
jgi:signal transduction histidine kinase